MKQLALSMLVFTLVTGGFVDGVDAQDPIVTDPPGTTSIRVGQPPAAAQSYEDYKRDELARSARRSRNALIGLSASTVVGAALLFPALANQCGTFEFAGTTEVRCTTAGRALVGIGLPLFWGGITGVLISGIMFGVRQGKLRRLDDRMAYEKSRAVRWDPASSRFVF